MPRLIVAGELVIMRAGARRRAEGNGVSYLKIPVDGF
jgi:hypothetical protein